MNEPYDDENLFQLATALGERMTPIGLTLATAESCTGGWIAKVITEVPGSSAWFDGGFVTYSNRAKQRQLGVDGDTLDAHGAVSEAVVLEMAEGAREGGDTDIAVAVSGIAGPGGGTPEKAVGTVWIAWAKRGELSRAQRFLFDGDRDAVRRQTVAAALEGLEAMVG